MRHVVVATAGHVDHGKSALVRALTGTDPDRLPEEKAREITIDLGFAHLPLAPDLECAVIDVPGHEDFVRNMACGVYAADAALFAVAADDGWMPQTEEHLEILAYFGVRQAVIALTKVDRPGADADARTSEIRRHLAGSAFAAAPIVPVCAPAGDGLPALRSALEAAARAAPARRAGGRPRLWIDRAFALRGIGTVVTGTLGAGSFRAGDAAMVLPQGWPVRIRGLQSHGRDCAAAVPGMRTALNLTEVAPRGGEAAAIDDRIVGRGQLVCGVGGAAEEPAREGRDCADVWLTRSGRRSPLLGCPAVRHGAPVFVHVGTACLPARLVLASRGSLAPGSAEPAQLRFEAPVSLWRGDRFVLRDRSARATLAGGIVLDPGSRQNAFRRPSQQAFLLAQAGDPENPALAILAGLKRGGACALATLLLDSPFGRDELATAAAGLANAGHAQLLPGWVADKGRWRELWRRAAAEIDSHHRAHPEQAGLPQTALRAALAGHLADDALFQALLDELAATAFRAEKGVLARREHRPSLPPRLLHAGALLRTRLAEKPLDPPPRRELAPGFPDQEALRFLIGTGEVVELSPEIVMLAAPFAQARAAVRGLLEQRPGATVSDLKAAVGATRRIMVPLLERLDRDGVTERHGDLRRLRGQFSALRPA